LAGQVLTNECLQHLPQRLIVSVPREYGSSRDQLDKYAADRPYIHGATVVSVAYQEFRRSVPSGGDVVREFGVGLVTHETSEAEVTNLEDTVLGEKHILWLEISVDNRMGVDVMASFQNLPDYFLGLKNLFEV
jgi:hypothetical protein